MDEINKKVDATQQEQAAEEKPVLQKPAAAKKPTTAKKPVAKAAPAPTVAKQKIEKPAEPVKKAAASQQPEKTEEDKAAQASPKKPAPPKKASPAKKAPPKKTVQAEKTSSVKRAAPAKKTQAPQKPEAGETAQAGKAPQKPVVGETAQAAKAPQKPVVGETAQATKAPQKPVVGETAQATKAPQKPVVGETAQAAKAPQKPVVGETAQAAKAPQKPVVGETAQAAKAPQKPVVGETAQAAKAPQKPAVGETAQAAKAPQKPAVGETAQAAKTLQKPVVGETAQAGKAPQKPAAQAAGTAMKPPQAAGAKKTRPAEMKEPAGKPVPHTARSVPRHSAPKQDSAFMEKIWTPLLRPVVTLVVVCALLSFLLAVTNNATQPQIEANTLAAAQEARQLLLPAADGFEEQPLLEGHDDVVSVFKATNEAGYIIEAFGRGYGGKVPAMVAFDEKGSIQGVRFPANNETPGLGQKLVTDESFAEQFVGRPNLSVQRTDIDIIASATISSNAALSAVNAAISLFNEQVVGIDPENLTPDQVLTMLLPAAGTLTEITLDEPNITEAYKGADGNYIIMAQAGSEPDKLVTAAVSMNPAGVILGLWLDTSTQGEGYGTEVAKSQEFINSFAGQSAPVFVDTVAGATTTSDLVGMAIDYALAALPLAKEAS